MPLLLASCKTEEPPANRCVLHVLVNLPDSVKLSYESITIEDRNMGTMYRVKGAVSVGDTCLAYYTSVPVGFYDLTFNATVKVSEDYSYNLRAYNQNVTIQDTTELTMQAFVLPKSNDFVIAEVFFAGTQTPEGKNYIGDKYFVLVNNSDTHGRDSDWLLRRMSNHRARCS